jgi:hypothetical protein
MGLGISTQSAKFGYGTAQAGPFTALEGVQEIPSLLGKPSKIDVTCLSDTVKKNIFGVKDLGDLQFKMVYDNSGTTSNFRVLKGYADAKTLTWFQIEFPDKTGAQVKGTLFTFSAYVNVETDAAQVDKALGFTCTLALQSEITVVNPA